MALRPSDYKGLEAIECLHLLDMRSFEQIQLTLGIEDSLVPIDELISILDGFQGVTLSINETLNKTYSCGFDKVTVQVLGFEHGSFRIPFSIDKFSEHILCPVLSTVIGSLIVWYLTTDNNQMSIQLPNEQVSIDRTEFDCNKKVRDSVNKIAKTVINSEKISNLSLKYRDEDNQEVSVQIDKNQLANRITDIEGDVVIQNISNVRLEIVSPTLEAKSVQWKVRYEGKVRSMKMNDLGFLELIGRRDIAFSKGDIITCNIQITEITEIDGSVKLKYAITQVHNFPHYHRVINAEEQNLNL